jgi:hypothetical protein
VVPENASLTGQGGSGGPGGRSPSVRGRTAACGAPGCAGWLMVGASANAPGIQDEKPCSSSRGMKRV